MGHIVLLGDSIFDNAAYVPDQPPVIEQLRRLLPPGWRATLLAVDGHCVADVAGQFRRRPEDATHFVISVGGNDALGEARVLAERADSVAAALRHLDGPYRRFESEYQAMLEPVLAVDKPATVCTIYDSIPGLGRAEQIALLGFNDAILRSAFRSGLPVIDLRLVCNQPADYSRVSPIEPSMIGGMKIARIIARAVTSHDFTSGHSCVYV